MKIEAYQSFLLSICYLLFSSGRFHGRWISPTSSFKESLLPGSGNDGGEGVTTDLLCRSRDEEFNSINNSKDESPQTVPFCATDIKGLLSGLDVPGHTATASLLPPWMNLPLAIRGQQVAINNSLSTSFGSFFGLELLLAVPQISDMLLFTGNSHTRESSSKRYAATIVQVSLWIRRALSRDTDLNWVLESLQNVRFIHEHIAARASASLRKKRTLGLDKYLNSTLDTRLWNAFEKDLANSNVPQGNRILPEEMTLKWGDNSTVPMNQFSFALTQWAFLAVGIIRPNAVLNRYAKDEDLAAFAHLWAVLGHAMGLQDEYNIALKKDIQTLRPFLADIFDKYITPSLFHMNLASKILWQALLQASPDLLPGIDPYFPLRRALKDVLGIQTPNLDKLRTPYAAKLDFLYEGIVKPASLWRTFVPLISPFLKIYHFKVGFQFFGAEYSTDEAIAKNCYYYNPNNYL